MINNNGDSKIINWPKVIGQGILLGSIQFSIASTELSSKFSILNFSKDQVTLQNAADSLRTYMYVATLWMIGTMLVMYGQNKMHGAITGLIFNLICMAWIYFSYVAAFKVAATKNKLEVPTVWKLALY